MLVQEDELETLSRALALPASFARTPPAQPLFLRQGHTRTAIARFERTAMDRQLFYDDVVFLDSRRAGIWCFLVAPAPQLPRLLAALSLAADTGLGGDRSSGRGQLALRAEPYAGALAPRLELPEPPSPHLLLSLAEPRAYATPSAPAALDLDKGAYEREVRKGKTDLAAGGAYHPAQYRLVLLTPGSVLEASGQVGRLVPAALGQAAGGPPFEVYRLARGLFVPWTGEAAQPGAGADESTGPPGDGCTQQAGSVESEDPAGDGFIREPAAEASQEPVGDERSEKGEQS